MCYYSAKLYHAALGCGPQLKKCSLLGGETHGLCSADLKASWEIKWGSGY